MPPVKFFPGFFLDIVDKRAQYSGGELPHRITLFPPLQQPYQTAFGEELRTIVNPLQPFEVTVATGTAMFGDESEPQLVKLIEPSERLQLLHTTLVRVLGNLLHDEKYRQPYNPHISVASGQEVPDGTTIHIGGFSILEKIQGQSWTVVDKIGLKGDNDEITS